MRNAKSVFILWYPLAVILIAAVSFWKLATGASRLGWGGTLLKMYQ